MSMPLFKPEKIEASAVGRLSTVDNIIDSLSLGRTHYFLVVAAALGYTCDAFDTYIVGFSMPSIAAAWKLSPVFNGMLASAGMWGMFVGALVWGPLIDRFGRKPGFVATVLGFSSVTGCTAFSAGTNQFLIFRFVSGLFLGGMLPVVSALVAEQVPAKRRGRLVTIPPLFWPVGLFAAAAAAFFLIPRFGWRALFVVGAAPAILCLLILKKVPESARWLLTKNKQPEAIKVLITLGASEKDVERIAPAARKTSGTPLRVLLRPPYRKRFALTTSVLFFGFFGYYGFVLWLPSILAVHFKMKLAHAFEYTIWIGVFAILGKLTAYLTIDRFGRRQLFYVGFGLAGFASLLFGLLTQPVYLLAVACMLSLLLEQAAAGCVVLPTELFPSQVRGTANAWSSAAGKLAAALSPLVFGFLMARQLYYGIFVVMAIFFWVACLLVFTVDVDPQGKALGDLGSS